MPKAGEIGEADKAFGGGPSIADRQIRTHTHTHTFVVESFKVPEPQTSHCCPIVEAAAANLPVMLRACALMKLQVRERAVAPWLRGEQLQKDGADICVSGVSARR